MLILEDPAYRLEQFQFLLQSTLGKLCKKHNCFCPLFCTTVSDFNRLFSIGKSVETEIYFDNSAPLAGCLYLIPAGQFVIWVNMDPVKIYFESGWLEESLLPLYTLILEHEIGHFLEIFYLDGIRNLPNDDYDRLILREGQLIYAIPEYDNLTRYEKYVRYARTEGEFMANKLVNLDARFFGILATLPKQ